MEVLELVDLLADRRKLDRLARDGLDGQRSPAARVAVELRQDDAVEGDPLLERLGDGHGLLARHRVEDEQDVMWLRCLAHRRELLHQRLVDLQAAGGVDDHDVSALRLCLLDALRRRLHRVGRSEDGHLDLLAELLQLRDGGGALQVRGDERGRRALLAEQQRELGSGGRLARALEACEQDHRRALAGHGELRAARAHQRRELLVDDLHHLLAGRQALRDVLAERALLDAIDELLDHLEVDVGLEQREADLAHRFRDRLLVQAPALPQVAERGLEPVAERVEHVVGEVYVAFSAPPNPKKGVEMAQVAKVVTVIGSSPESFAKAADAAVQEAAKTLRGITGADVISMSAEVAGDRITEYRTTVNIAFAVER
jgi:flavin-binding protein dodecin